MSKSKKVILGYALDDNELIITEDDAKKLTHINVAFGRISQGDILTDNLKVINYIDKLKSYNPNLKILLSLVSASADDFSVGSSTGAGRRKIAASCAKVIKDYKFDGIDLDWEFPCCPENFITASPDDKQNFTLLCQAIREELDKIDGKHYLFTIAAGGDQYFVDSTEMDKVEKYLDYVFLMTYDLRCGFHSLTGHHTNLYTSTGDLYRTSVDAAVKAFNKAGVPKEKIVVGAAFYSRKWDNVTNRNNGYLQLTTGAGNYGPVYHELIENYINKNGYTRYWDDECKAPYLFNGDTFISYDDVESITYKCEYVKREECGGMFYWQHSYDATRSLLDTMYRCLNK